ncbi:hypothetical protein [Polaromonas sp. JS666]|uniref:hypothetical protein n=1 Tax=Polaromonas sp. (strain JS666 / ATCC BAA-500) TaxID=296591 RepID=UPI0015875789|nr:hypothetical protein [Polaromonas sp. JS666]
MDAALRLLWAEYPNRLEALQTAPWHILLLVKWALRDPQVRLRIGRRITPQEFDNLRRGVQELVGSEYREHPPQNLHLMMRSHFQQFDFQRPEGWGVFRWPALIARESRSKPSQRQFLEYLGLPPEHFMDLAFGALAAGMSRAFPLSPNWFAQLRPAYGASIDAFWNLVARDLPGLRADLLREGQMQQLPLRQELYEAPYLKRYPLFKMRNGHYGTWHPLLLARSLEEIVHLKLTPLQGGYTEPFSRLFEQYVWQLAQTMSSNTIIEDEYCKIEGERAPVVEAIIPCGECNVFVEAKMALFGDDVLLTDNEMQAYQKTKRVRDGIKQAWKVGKSVRLPASRFSQCTRAAEDFLLVVTSRELFLGDGQKLLRLYPADKFNYPDEECRSNMPLHNVFILSVETYERLSVAVASGAVVLPLLLKEAVSKNKDPSTSAILFEDFFGKYVKSWGMTELLDSARKESQRRLAHAFGTSEDFFG